MFTEEEKDTPEEGAKIKTEKPELSEETKKLENGTDTAIVSGETLLINTTIYSRIIEYC